MANASLLAVHRDESAAGGALAYAAEALEHIHRRSFQAMRATAHANGTGPSPWDVVTAAAQHRGSILHGVVILFANNLQPLKVRRAAWQIAACSCRHQGAVLFHALHRFKERGRAKPDRSNVRVGAGEQGGALAGGCEAVRRGVLRGAVERGCSGNGDARGGHEHRRRGRCVGTQDKSQRGEAGVAAVLRERVASGACWGACTVTG